MGINILQSTMSPNANTILVYKGASKDVDLKIVKDIKDPNGNPFEVPFDLTGCSLFFTVRKTLQDPKYIIYKTTNDSSQIAVSNDPTTGDAIVFIGFIDTELLEPGLYYFDVWVQEPSGKRYPVVEPSEFMVLSASTHFN